MKAEEENRELEARLQQAQKMEAIGTLAGGIAHDFNNILSPIMAHSELGMMDLLPEDPVHENLKEILRAAERAKDLVKQILTFARRKEEDRMPIRVSRIASEAMKFLKSTIPSTIEIKYDFSLKQDTVLADPIQLNQIIMNLCTNAAHAMKERGGILKVTTSSINIEMGNTDIIPELIPGNYVRLSVDDTGAGIDPQIMDRLFEPYFTTKGVGEGTGMGLAMVHGIVKSYGGGLIVKSEPGKGSAFHVMLPLIEADPEILQSIEQADDIPHGNERILLVDDEVSTVKIRVQRARL